MPDAAKAERKKKATTDRVSLTQCIKCGGERIRVLGQMIQTLAGKRIKRLRMRCVECNQYQVKTINGISSSADQ